MAHRANGLIFRVLFLLTCVLQRHWLYNTLPLKAYTFNGQAVPVDNIDAELLARGVALQLALHLRT